MASTTKTVPTRSVVVTGPGTVVTHAPVVAPATGGYSLHDCAHPGHAGAHNVIWPRGGTITFKQGLVVHAQDATGGTVTVTTV